MQRLAELIRREPLVVRAVAAAVLGILAAWGIVALTPAQTEAVLTATSVLLPIIVALITRSRVTPVDRKPTPADEPAATDEPADDDNEPAPAADKTA